MGGNAFKNLNLRRIKREEIKPTLEFVVNSIDIKDFTLEYVLDNLMGSTGKQDDSGDIDVAVNSHKVKFYGERELPVFNLRSLAHKIIDVLPERHVSLKTLKGGQFQTAFPINGDFNNGLVQIDFISGNPEWLKYSHFSPGKDVSPYKGVMRSTLLGVLAKRHKDFELHDDDGNRIARVGLHFNLELGLYRRWEISKRKGDGLSEVSRETFETAFASPHFTDFGYLTNPDEVSRILFDGSVSLDEIQTLEGCLSILKYRLSSEDYFNLLDRFKESLKSSSVSTLYTDEQLNELEIFK